jgi:hypothetical protein
MSTRGTILTADFDSPYKGNVRLQSFVVATGATIYKGALCYINASGLLAAVPQDDGATDNSALRVVGQAVEAVASAAAGAKLTVRTETVVRLANLSGNDIAQAQVGDLCYAPSDNEVSKTQANGSGKAPAAGVIMEVDSDGVWVYLSPMKPS